MSDSKSSNNRKLAEFRFSVVGKLLASPAPSGELSAELTSLAEKLWKHPISGEGIHLSFSTIERWYYLSLKKNQGPIESLRASSRKDRGIPRVISEACKKFIQEQYKEHPSWSVQLHYDNFSSAAKKDPALCPVPSYSSMKRFFRSQGFFKEARSQNKNRPGFQLAMERKNDFEIRSYENEFVLGLWHLDFHHGSRQITNAKGVWCTPMLLAIIDDNSRLICHLQWYFSESAQELIHGFIQALQKRGLPRMLMTDNGSAMISEEFRNGLASLSILHETTLPYSPYQNGKQENFWGQIEGRLLPMLEAKKNVTLKELNDITQAWIEIGYNKKIHSEIKTTPLEKYLTGKYVGRPCPTMEALRCSFMREEKRKIRRSDGTVSVGGTRFEIPSAYCHLSVVHIKYLRWDLSMAYLFDQTTGAQLFIIFPLNVHKNAGGYRREKTPLINSTEGKEVSEIPPLLKNIMEEYASTGLPPAYLPTEEDKK
jgi:transposase InsO family protein